MNNLILPFMFLTLHIALGSAKRLHKKVDAKTYVITETSGPTSFDPLDADYTQNLPIARMIYATPIEVDQNDRLSSLVLESFKYDPIHQKMEWVVKDNIYYSTGQIITPEDIAFSVARMAYKRPNFPIIEHIADLSAWIKNKNALSTFPKGIEIDGNKITITFVKDVSHSLFRFTLELFSILPKNCVDVKTNTMTCKDIYSGRYSIESKNDSFITFKRRLTENVPEIMHFRYLPASKLQDYVSSFDTNTIVAANNSMISNETMSLLKKEYKVLFLPASRFSILELNPDASAFKDKKCRQIFAKTFRENFKNLKGYYESSIFTKITTGYIEPEVLQETISIPSNAIANCQNLFKKYGINWGFVESERNSDFVNTLEKTLKDFDLTSDPILYANRSQTMDAFSEGETSILNAGSGFWAYDPSGDLQMLFTPNLHKPLNFVTRDPHLQKLIRNVVNNPEAREHYLNVNKYLYDESIVNIYSHVSRFYFSKNKDSLKVAQLGYSAPTPWQVFEL